MILDQLILGNWLQTEDGAKGRNRPDPVSPLATKKGRRHFGKTDRPGHEVRKLLQDVAKGKWARNGSSNGSSDDN